jgi:hypothetical protein
MRPRSRSFRHVKVGQTVTRVVPGEGATQLRVTGVDRRLIHCAELTFERDGGFEVDPVLGPGLWGVVQSRLQPGPRRVVRETVPLRARMRRALQIVLFTGYLIMLAGIGVAIGFRRDSLALALGAGVVVLWVSMNLASPHGRTDHPAVHRVRRPG